MKVALFSTKTYDREYFELLNTNGTHQLAFFETSLTEHTARLTTGFEGVCVFVNDKIDEPTLQTLAGNGVKVIALRCAGFNNVDIKTAKRLGIKVVRVPAYSPQGVAEHAVALILTLNRKIHKAYNRTRENNFSLEKLMGFNLHNKTVGVIGTGKIGNAFCQIMLGFGCKVLAFDPVESSELKNLGVLYQPIENILSQSDIISIHCPLGKTTRHMFDEKSFAQMKQGAMLINTSRGAIINTTSAIEALRSGKLGYLGIDTYEQEENLFYKDLSESIVRDETFNELIGFHNVLVTAHQGFFTHEAMSEIVRVTLNNFSDFESGAPLKNEVSDTG